MKEITKSEAKVMMVNWNSDEDLGLQEVMSLLEIHYHSDWKPQTVSTFLARLTQKGYLNMYRQGRQFLYHVTIPKEEYLQWMLSSLVDFWFDGKKENLLLAIEQMLR
ncbi:BlaI/MecI/CopY family transcriptional regulator [Hominifimenecus sp. rT4P-3]|uniref:BlaI/MecI/CopY family transcriptional regulator n=1 Tax=Hominifimenecus sp. rT4P-3 TaxID=3242979 RepID=UPI003DA451B6